MTAVISGGAVLLLEFLLAVGGAWLILLGGSWYYLATATAWRGAGIPLSLSVILGVGVGAYAIAAPVKPPVRAAADRGGGCGPIGPGRRTARRLAGLWQGAAKASDTRRSTRSRRRTCAGWRSPGPATPATSEGPVTRTRRPMN